jgi:hypothetical protein
MARLWSIMLGMTLLGMVGLPGISWAYKGIPVKNGATITGKATLKGPVPEPRVFPLALYPFGTFCKKISDGQGNVRIEEITLGPDDGLNDVVVAVQGVKKGKPFDPIVADIVVQDCQFFPFVSVVQNHGLFTLRNEDPILHNSQLYQSEKGNLLLTVPNPPHSSGTFPIKFERKKRIYQMICGMHEFMQTWGYAVDNPYYAITGSEGEFTIDQLPPGTYQVTAWRPHFKPIKQKVTVKADQTVSLDFEFHSGEVVRPHYEQQETFRIAP